MAPEARAATLTVATCDAGTEARVHTDPGSPFPELLVGSYTVQLRTG